MIFTSGTKRISSNERGKWQCERKELKNNEIQINTLCGISSRPMTLLDSNFRIAHLISLDQYHSYDRFLPWFQGNKSRSFMFRTSYLFFHNKTILSSPLTESKHYASVFTPEFKDQAWRASSVPLGAWQRAPRPWGLPPPACNVSVHAWISPSCDAYSRRGDLITGTPYLSIGRKRRKNIEFLRVSVPSRHDRWLRRVAENLSAALTDDAHNPSPCVCYLILTIVVRT